MIVSCVITDEHAAHTWDKDYWCPGQRGKRVVEDIDRRESGSEDGATFEREQEALTEIADRLVEQAQGRAADIEAEIEEISGWWRGVAEDDAKITAPKAVEYGAADLVIMGAAMAQLFPNGDALPPDELERVGQEMAVAFYTLGKVSRLFGAYQQGRLPGDDSWFDLTIYSMMARRIRETGRWV